MDLFPPEKSIENSKWNQRRSNGLALQNSWIMTPIILFCDS